MRIQILISGFKGLIGINYKTANMHIQLVLMKIVAGENLLFVNLFIPITGCSLGIGNRRILCLLIRIILWHISGSL